MKILIAGATGYIASELIPRLLDLGYPVRAMARDPRKLNERSWQNKVEIIQGDITHPAELAGAMNGIHTAYYLIHNMSSGRGYTFIELEGAKNFTQAAQTAGVKHIVYLGGLADPEQHIAPHMRSRIETGRVLREGNVPVTEFRAGVIAGSGSISFEMIRFMTELFPVIPGPKWLQNKTQPIAVKNVIDYLIAALDNPKGHGKIFEIGGPEIKTYQDLMQIYANVARHKRGFLILPYLPVWFMAFGIGLMTPVPRNIAYALVGGLSSDSIVLHDDALKAFAKIKLIDFESATAEAMKRLHPLIIERVWRDGENLKHEGFFIQSRERLPTLKPPKNFEIESQNANQTLFRNIRNLPGEYWIEWRKKESRIIETHFFAPRGLRGFLFWYLFRFFQA